MMASPIGSYETVDLAELVRCTSDCGLRRPVLTPAFPTPESAFLDLGTVSLPIAVKLRSPRIPTPKMVALKQLSVPAETYGCERRTHGPARSLGAPLPKSAGRALKNR